ncbi:transposase [bacterium]|nr:transposase [bacterium]
MSNYRRYYNNFNNPVFITIVTKFRKEVLIYYIDKLKESINKSIKKFKYKFIAGIILKDHCHIIISTDNPDDIPKIIHDIKHNFTQNLPDEFINSLEGRLTASEQKRGEKGVWQRRYYDHIIRNEEDLYKHIDYIHYNSMKHYNIPPKDWEYSSFKKFVDKGYYNIDWCNFNDKYNISELNLE